MNGIDAALAAVLAEAEKVLRRVLQLNPGDFFASRNLALILAQRGGEQEWREAQELLEASGTDEERAVGDRRLQAILLSRRGGIHRPDSRPECLLKQSAVGRPSLTIRWRSATLACKLLRHAPIGTHVAGDDC